MARHIPIHFEDFYEEDQGGMMRASSSSRDSVDFSIQLADASCPACLSMYSDSDPLRVPRLPPLCGHSMCTECIGKVRACVVCRRGFYGDASHFKINYTLMGLVAELARQGDSKEALIKCASCEGRSRVERMRVCRTCARGGRLNIRKAKRDEVNPYVFCSDCSIEKHLEQKHEMDKYIDYYNRSEMENINEKVRVDVAEIRQTLLKITDSAQANTQKWIHEMNKICHHGLKIRSSDECHRLRDQVDEEIKKIKEATDELLRAQQRYSQVTEESRDSLKKQLEDQKKALRREKGRQGSVFQRFGGIFCNRLSQRSKTLSAPTLPQEETPKVSNGDGKNE